MHDVEKAVEASFKVLVLGNKPYRSITVKEICEGAFISRRTFYANFVDKSAVLAHLFRSDAVEPVLRILDLLSIDEVADMGYDIIARYYQGIYDSREFYESLVKPMRWVDTSFLRVASEATSELIKTGVTRLNPDADQQMLEYTAGYHGYALALVVSKWICEGFMVTPEVMAKQNAPLLVPSLGMLLRSRGADLESVMY